MDVSESEIREVCKIWSTRITDMRAKIDEVLI